MSLVPVTIIFHRDLATASQLVSLLLVFSYFNLFLFHIAKMIFAIFIFQVYHITHLLKTCWWLPIFLMTKTSFFKPGLKDLASQTSTVLPDVSSLMSLLLRSFPWSRSQLDCQFFRTPFLNPQTRLCPSSFVICYMLPRPPVFLLCCTLCTYDNNKHLHSTCYLPETILNTLYYCPM